MRLFPVLYFVSLLLYLALEVHSQDDQSGFISIDCGIPADASYTDSATNLNYVSDSGFTDAGESKTILPYYNTSGLPQQLVALRSFPQGIRNCYTLKPVQGPSNRYLIRAWFMYGNYDSKDVLPQFDIHLGVEKWDTISFSKTTSLERKEIIHVQTSEYIYGCLVNTGLGTPFISALELRYFNTEISNLYTDDFVSLQLFGRVDFGQPLESCRYKDDRHDRIWDSIDYSNSSIVYNPEETLTELDFYVPYKVMRTAIAPDNTSNPLTITWEPLNVSDQFLIYLHLAEVQTLQSNQIREFNLYLNGNLWTPNNEPVIPTNQTSVVRSSAPELPASKHEIVMQKTERSTLPPIINALEVYSVKKFLQSQTHSQDAGSIMDIKSAYKIQIENWQGDPCVPQAYAWDGVGCSYNDYNFPRITTLNLSSSRLSGKIASSIANLTMIRSLDLSNNNLSGEVPDFLSQLIFLRILNIKGNNFIGSVPSDLLSKSKSGHLLLSMDASLGGGDTNRCTSSSCKKSSNKSTIQMASLVSAFVLIIIAVIILTLVVRNRKERIKITSLETLNRQFTYSEILRITNNLEKSVGEGGFGKVYHGHIGDTQVAVKMLSATSAQGYREFETEAKLLMRIHHKNLTALVGYCMEDNHLGIIYEYMANGDLDGYLAGRKPYVLSWEQRIRIAIDAAEGFEYLHHGCRPTIIHRDVKSTNILLSENFQGKLADFGLSRVIPSEAGSHIITEVARTLGYLDPEYYASNRLTKKSDVYSFGIVLLEIITGRPARGIDDDSEHIVRWVSSRIQQGDIKVVVDSRIRETADINSVQKAVEIAMLCVSIASDNRPPMNFVATHLKECLETDFIWNETRREELIGEMSLTLESNGIDSQE
nr:PREDICTED: putative leucine-rich repeat receptor-like protein kinase At2g19210 [Daucus carota subsp. sativus]